MTVCTLSAGLRVAFFIPLGVLGPALATTAYGQQETPARSERVIEEILVTAEKREASLQDVPLSVTALGAQELDTANIISPVDLNAKVPGLTFAPNEGFQNIVSLRGLGFEANQNDIALPSVSFHIDGIFIASPISLNQDFLDVDRIEILRGPQGTVFGQNSTGGTILVLTNQPEIGVFEGHTDITVGSFDTVRARGHVNIPLSDSVAARVAAAYYGHEGFAEIVGTDLAGYELDQADNVTGRFQLKFEPSDNFSATFRAQIFNTDVHDRAQRNILDTSGDPRELTQNFPGTFGFDSEIYSATIEYTTNWATIKSITSWQDEFTEQSLDNDRGVAAFIQPQDIVPSSTKLNETFIQEINIVSEGDGLFDWIFGAFYLDQERNINFLEFLDGNFDGVIDQTIDPVNPFSNPDLGFETSSTPTRESLSIYAQATIGLTDALELTVGGRYTDDEVASTVTNFFGAFGSQLIATETSDFTVKAALEYNLSDENMVYLSFSEGFKPGGSNLTFGILTGPTFEDETVEAWELGAKNRFFSDQLQLNLAAFFYDFENFQFMATDPVPFSGGVDNIPETEIYGLELELSWFVLDNLRIDANATFLEGEVSQDFLALDNALALAAQNEALAMGASFGDAQFVAAREAVIQNLNGNSPPKLPDFTGNLSLQHTTDVEDRGEFVTTISYTYRDSYNYRVFNNSTLDILPSYDIIDLTFSWQPYDSPWTAEFLVRNLQDDDAVISRWTNNFGVGHTSEQFSEPRQFLFRLGYEF